MTPGPPEPLPEPLPRPGPAGRRVLLLLGTLQVGGAEKNVASLAPELQALGVDVAVGTLSTHRDSYLPDRLPSGVTRIDFGARRLLDPVALVRLARHLRRRRIDVVHGEDHAGALMGVAASALTGTPLVVTRHVVDYQTDRRRERVKDGLLDRALRHRRAGRVIAVSEDLRRHMVGELGVPPELVVTIHNGIDTDAFDHPELSRNEARRRLGWPPDAPIVTMVAVLRRGKGHEVLFRSLPQCRREVPDLRAVIVGGGDQEADIRARAAALGGVEVLGERDDVPRILRASDVVVLPSWAEALPTVLIEAAAAGVPVVATDVSGVAEVVVDGVTGYVVAPGDAAMLATRVAALLTDPELAAGMGRAARTRARSQFSLGAQAAATARAYEDVLGVGGAGHPALRPKRRWWPPDRRQPRDG